MSTVSSAVLRAAALLLLLGGLRAAAQETVLIQEVVSREVTVSIAGKDPATGVRQALSRESALYVTGGPATPFAQAISREYDVVRVSNTPPPAISGLLVTVSSTGTAATLDWSAYNQFAVGDVARFNIYVSDTGPITNVSGLTPYLSVGGDRMGAALTGLTALKDHYFAVVPVDGLQHFVATVNYAAGYVLSPQAVSREVGVAIGPGAPGAAPQAVSRELDLVVVPPAAPAAIPKLTVSVDAAGDAVTLDWSAYNQYAVDDLRRFDIYLSDTGPFTSVSGMTPYASVGGNVNSVALSGLAKGKDHYFAVVPVDGLGHFNAQVSYAAAYVLLPQLVSREFSLENGGDPPGPALMAVSREVSVVVPTAATPGARSRGPIAASSPPPPPRPLAPWISIGRATTRSARPTWRSIASTSKPISSPM